MTSGAGDGPEETMPFTHQPYGSEEPDNPSTSPSGAANQPSGPGYVPPVTPPPPLAGPAYPWGTPWEPTYGQVLTGGQQHKGANTAMVLGIIAMVCLGVALFCCVTLPGVLVAPFAWAQGARAKREIDAFPGAYANRGQAVAGIVMGVIGSVVGVLMIAAFVGVALLIGSSWSLV